MNGYVVVRRCNIHASSLTAPEKSRASARTKKREGKAAKRSTTRQVDQGRVDELTRRRTTTSFECKHKRQSSYLLLALMENENRAVRRAMAAYLRGDASRSS